MITEPIMYNDFLKWLSKAYTQAGLPLYMRPLLAFVLYGISPVGFFTDKGLINIVCENEKITVECKTETFSISVAKSVMNILNKLEILYTEDKPISPGLVVRVLHAEHTQFEDEELNDPNYILSLSPTDVVCIRRYINEVDLRLAMETNYVGASGSIVEFNSNTNALTLKVLLKSTTTFNYNLSEYYAFDLRPNTMEVLKHLTNLLYINLFMKRGVNPLIDDDFIFGAEEFINTMLHFHIHRIPFLNPTFVLTHIKE